MQDAGTEQEIKSSRNEFCGNYQHNIAEDPDLSYINAIVRDAEIILEELPKVMEDKNSWLSMVKHFSAVAKDDDEEDFQRCYFF